MTGLEIRPLKTILLAIPLLASLASPAAILAQDAVPAPDLGEGFRLSYGPTVAYPFLDEAAHEPFSHIGDFRVGLGVQAAVGYQLRGVELLGTADLSGFELGEPVIRDGIDMGRISSVLRTFAIALWWSPAPQALAGWSPRIGVGYVGSAMDNVRITPDELTPAMFAVLRTADRGDESKPAGIEGNGVRVGLGMEREVGADLAALFRTEVDRISYDTFTFGSRDIPWSGGVGWIPQVSISIRWAPS